MKTHQQHRVDALNPSKNIIDSNVVAVVGLADPAGMNQRDETLIALAVLTTQQPPARSVSPGRPTRALALSAPARIRHRRRAHRAVLLRPGGPPPRARRRRRAPR